jgi:hypothetical protein
LFRGVTGIETGSLADRGVHLADERAAALRLASMHGDGLAASAQRFVRGDDLVDAGIDSGHATVSPSRATALPPMSCVGEPLTTLPPWSVLSPTTMILKAV